MASKEGDYEKVRGDIKGILKNAQWDDGHLGPVLVRLAWHASGTYDKKSGSGGSSGGTMRYEPEVSDGANAGLQHARAFLEPIKQRHPWISYGDLWTLAGCVSIEDMGGPKIPWKPGRQDIGSSKPEAAQVPPNGRLPDAAKGQDHVRQVFYRMGFDDREIVALIGAHALGRCHTDRSGYEGPWTHSPTRFSNSFFTLLSKGKWTKREWSGPEQYTDETGELMMTPADMSLLKDAKFRQYVEVYANNKQQFFDDFAKAFGKLLELGVKRPTSKL